MMKFAHILFFLCIFVVRIANASSAWPPGERPDLHAILQLANKDAREGRYDAALQKHVWFRENALKYEPSMYGVRNSFALGYWKELAQHHPPSMQRLIDFRDQAKQIFLASGTDRDAFADFAAINSVLRDSANTLSLFQHIDETNPHLARKVFMSAKAAIVREKAYQLYAKYAVPADEIAYAVKMYSDLMRITNRGDRRAEIIRSNERFFIEQATTVVAIYSVLGRRDEAQAAAQEAAKTLNNELMQRRMSEALSGIVPNPWPQFEE